MKFNILTTLILILIACGCNKFEYDFFRTNEIPPLFPQEEWEKVRNPENFEWNIEALSQVRDYAKDIKSEALMIIDKGRLIAAYGDTNRKFYVASVRKSYLSLLYGFYIDSLISLESTIKAYGINDKPPPLNEQEKSATIENLLTSSSGIYHKSAANANNDDLPSRNSHQPGERFYYNNWDFNALGTIFNQRTNKDLFEGFQQKIGSKIGLEDFNWEVDGRYDFSEVSEHPAYHFDMTCRDMARIGVLLLNKGEWEGKQIIPLEWIEQSTTPQIEVGSDFGNGSYGYMWWIMDNDEFGMTGLSASSFSAQGNWSQLIIIDPENEIVIVHRAHKRNIASEKILGLIKRIIQAKD